MILPVVAVRPDEDCCVAVLVRPDEDCCVVVGTDESLALDYYAAAVFEVLGQDCSVAAGVVI